MNTSSHFTDAVINMDGVCKVFNESVHALENVNLKVEKGACYTIIGPSGAGKTTLLNLIFGMDHPTSGSMQIAGIDATHASFSTRQALKRRMGYVFQDFRLIDNWSCYDNVAVVLEINHKPRSYIRSRVWKVLEWVGIQHRIHEQAGRLSGGERQRLALARAIVHTPEILLADEPLSSIDPETARDIMGLIYRINKRGVTVVLASHGNHKVEGARVIELDNGSIKVQG